MHGGARTIQGDGVHMGLGEWGLNRQSGEIINGDVGMRWVWKR